MGSTQVRGSQIFNDDITSDDLADGSVRGATGNAGTQREIATGTVSTPDLRDDAVNAAKLLETDDYQVGSLRVSNGSSGTPALRFNSSSGTGLYLVATDILGVATGGSERIRIDDNGNVGIGAAPVTNGILTLTSTTKAFVPPRMTTTQRDAIGSPSAGMLIYNTTTSALNLYTTSWGSVGGAETDPFSLHINGDNSPTANINWNQFQILNLVVHVVSSDPGTPVEGQIWYNSTSKQWKGYNGTSTVLLG